MKTILFLFWSFLSFSAQSQSTFKIYAYSRENTAGMIPSNRGTGYEKETGFRNTPGLSYYIYALFPANAVITIEGLWMDGKYFKTASSNVKTTPVIIKKNNIPGDTEMIQLVPATRLKVVSIEPTATKINILLSSRWFREIRKNNALLLRYHYKGKIYFKGLKQIKLLPYYAGE